LFFVSLYWSKIFGKNFFAQFLSPAIFIFVQVSRSTVQRVFVDFKIAEFHNVDRHVAVFHNVDRHIVGRNTILPTVLDPNLT
jgi:hypothetical protein